MFSQSDTEEMLAFTSFVMPEDLEALCISPRNSPERFSKIQQLSSPRAKQDLSSEPHQTPTQAVGSSRDGLRRDHDIITTHISVIPIEKPGSSQAVAQIVISLFILEPSEYIVLFNDHSEEKDNGKDKNNLPGFLRV